MSVERRVMGAAKRRDVMAQADVAKPPSLKILGEYLGLSPATISLVLNDAPGAETISEKTRARVLAAAKKFDYRPSFFGRALKNRRTFSIGVLVRQHHDDYCAAILEGVEELLMGEGYICLTLCHRRKPDLIEQYPGLLMDRAVEGFILIDTPSDRAQGWRVPVVSIGGYRDVANVTNIRLDQRRAADLGLRHLHQLGHRSLAFIRGSHYSSDSDDRWACFSAATQALGLTIDPDLVRSIALDVASPELGYVPMQRLLASKKKFTAVVAFNDQVAIGAIRAIREHGLRVPEDISVLGFDDIQAAAFQNPSLTTIRQPLTLIGRTAVQVLLKRIVEKDSQAEEHILIQPELVIRESTGVARRLRPQRSSVQEAE